MKKYTVSEFTRSVKSLLETAFPDTVAVTGEVSNFSRASSGHIYFTLKDSGGQLRAVFFKRYCLGSAFVPRNGDKVQAVGDVGLYEADGSYQLVVKRIFYDSAGDFWRRFEETKRRLEAEGLFDEARKRPVPRFPARIALITSPTGAAVRDFIVTAAGTGGAFDIEVWCVPVQGAEASLKIAAAISSAGAMTRRYDAVVVTRGGGSLEDLSVFNDETVARAAAASAVPVVSAVGHERDFTVIDFACDLRAATPTAAASLLSSAYADAVALIGDFYERIIEAAVNKVQNMHQRLDFLELRLKAVSPSKKIEGYKNALSSAVKDLRFACAGRVSCAGRRLSEAVYSLRSADPSPRVRNARLRIDSAEKAVRAAFFFCLSYKSHKLEELSGKLSVMNPDNVVERGYAVVFRNGKIVSSADEISVKEDIEIKLKDGYIYSFVTGKKLEASNG